jgi:ketosteroid isomerase-like protein
MSPSEAQVRDLFGHLESGDADTFFAAVADDVRWTVMGTHPLAGEYRSKKNFRTATFARLNRVLREGVLLRVTHVITSGDWAVVELEALSTALDGKPFANRYCWVCRFDGATIVEVRAYLDSALVARTLAENEDRSESPRGRNRA